MKKLSVFGEVRLTEGNIWQKIILFAIPLLISSLIQQLYNTADLIFVGNYLDKQATIAVGSGSLLITCIINFFTGLSVGTSVVMGQFFGAGDKDSMHRTVHTAIVLCLVGGTILAFIGILGAPLFLKILNISSDILPLGVIYMRIYFMSIFSIMFFNIGSGILRAIGDSTSPMLYQFIGGIINIIANYVFIVILSMGISGAAFATFASQSVAALLIIRKLMKLPDEYRLRLNKIKIDSSVLNTIIKIGIPSGIQGMLLTLSNLVVQSNINMLEINSIAAFVAYYKVELFIYLPIQAIGQASMTFVSQNVGADKPVRARKGIYSCILIGIVVSVCASVLLIQMSDVVFSLFTKDESVIEIGYEIIKVTFPYYFIYVFLEVFSNTLRGAGRSIQPMLIILLNMCGVRVVMVYLMMHVAQTAQGIAVVYPVTWLTASVSMIIYFKISNCLGKNSKKK